MALKVDKYQLGAKETNTVIFFPYTWGGEQHNNRQLLTELALLTGALVIGAQTPGTGRLVVGPRTRTRLQQGWRFTALATEYAEEVDALLRHHGQPHRLLAAQSGRVALGARMQASEFRPFTHVLLRDGVNLCAPESPRSALERLRAQPSGGEHGHYPERKNIMHRLRDFRARWHGRVEALNHLELMCSEESRYAVEALVREDRFSPITHITYERGITGTPAQQEEFAQHLQVMRQAAVISHGGGFHAPLRATVEPGNHADLLNPRLLHAHVLLALGLPAVEDPPLPPMSGGRWLPDRPVETQHLPEP